MRLIQYLGIILGAIYGFAYRLLCERVGVSSLYDELNVYSITFIWGLPLVIGMIPIVFTPKEWLEARWKQFFYPVFSVLLFFIFTLSSGLEDWLCILILCFLFYLFLAWWD